MAPLSDCLVECGDKVVGVPLGKACVCPCAWRMLLCIVVALSLKLLELWNRGSDQPWCSDRHARRLACFAPESIHATVELDLGKFVSS